MAFVHRNWEHQRIYIQICKDAEQYNYILNESGHEHLKTPIPSNYNDDVAWSVRAQQDGVIIGKKTVSLLEVKSKLNKHKNISIELKPLIVYKQKPTPIYIACETIYKGGLQSIKVQDAKEIPIDIILIPNREDNINLYETIVSTYPSARIINNIKVKGGSGTPFVLIEPETYKDWMSWNEFRNKIILDRLEGQITLDEYN